METGAEPDYKALYEAAKANARKWEKQAKTNKEVAAALDKSEQDRLAISQIDTTQICRSGTIFCRRFLIRFASLIVGSVRALLVGK